MEAIRLVETITDKGLVINDPRLEKYVACQAEVIIFPMECMKEYMLTKFPTMATYS